MLAASEGLPPDVRSSAARAAFKAWNTVPYDDGQDAWWAGAVDAVTSVVAPEIERPLQARIAELEAANAAVEEENDLLRDVIQQKHARVEVLTAALTEITNNDSDPGYLLQRIARAALAAGVTESEASDGLS